MDLLFLRMIRSEDEKEDDGNDAFGVSTRPFLWW